MSVNINNNSCITKEIKIVCCSCYFNNWKEIKKNENDDWKFDEFEIGKSFRKFFFIQKELFHCCYNCFTEYILSNPFTLNEKKSGMCIIKKFIGEYETLDEICESCLLYFIEKYEHVFNIV